MCSAGIVTAGVMHAIYPRSFEFTTGARTLLIKGTAHPAANIPHQPDATCRFAVSAAHGGMEGTDLDGHAIRHNAAG